MRETFVDGLTGGSWGVSGAGFWPKKLKSSDHSYMGLSTQQLGKIKKPQISSLVNGLPAPERVS
jgi:hypothetical protein